MPTDYREPYAACDTCGARTSLPEGEHYAVGRKLLQQQGWTVGPNHAERPLRMLPHTYIWTCPGCRPQPA